jgi:hypothetical protein
MRFAIGLLLLKEIYGLPDAGVCERGDDDAKRLNRHCRELRILHAKALRRWSR